jgi:CheY-like chemotaxis protein
VKTVDDELEEQTDRRLARGLVMIVDDVAAVRRTIAQVVRDAGFDTVEACDGSAACRLLGETSPSLIFVDFMMPIMDGLQFLETARPTVPAVLMTGLIDRLPAPLPRSVVRVLEKPVRIAALKDALRLAGSDRAPHDTSTLKPRLPDPNDQSR